MRGQPVIIAEADFIGRHGVVFIHNRHDAQTQQGLHCGAAVQITPPIFGIFQRDQDLPGNDTMRGKHFLIGTRQPDLPHRRRRLRLFQRQNTRPQPQYRTSQSDGPGRHDHHIGAARPRLGHIQRKGGQPIQTQAMHPIDQQGRPDLDDQPLCLAHIWGGQGP